MFSDDKYKRALGSMTRTAGPLNAFTMGMEPAPMSPEMDLNVYLRNRGIDPNQPSRPPQQPMQPTQPAAAALQPAPKRVLQPSAPPTAPYQPVEGAMNRQGASYQQIGGQYDPNPSWMRRGTFSQIPMPAPMTTSAPSYAAGGGGAVGVLGASPAAQISEGYAKLAQQTMSRMSNARAGSVDSMIQNAVLTGLGKAEQRDLAALREQNMQQQMQQQRLALDQTRYDRGYNIDLAKLELDKERLGYQKARDSIGDARLGLAQQAEARKAGTEEARLGLARENLQLSREQNAQAALDKYVAGRFKDDPQGALEFQNALGRRMSEQGVPTSPAERLALFDEVYQAEQVMRAANAPRAGLFSNYGTKELQEGQLRLRGGAKPREASWADFLPGSDTSTRDAYESMFSGSRAPNTLVQMPDGRWQSVASLARDPESGAISPGRRREVMGALRAANPGASEEELRRLEASAFDSEGRSVGGTLLGAGAAALGTGLAFKSGRSFATAGWNKAKSVSSGARDLFKRKKS